GAGIDETLSDEIKITVIATGFDRKNIENDTKAGKASEAEKSIKAGTSEDVFLDNPMEDLDIPIFLRRREKK
ncbi:MAG: cell division protein FtsZ, partial [Tissierellia bacterium]|nr:cell division protein FtsZ [Tissierellia bacterium]